MFPTSYAYISSARQVSIRFCRSGKCIRHRAERTCICCHEMDGGRRGRGQNVEEMYKETAVVVRAERETSEQFGVGVGLRQ